jgi:hypothetical protein
MYGRKLTFITALLASFGLSGCQSHTAVNNQPATQTQASAKAASANQRLASTDTVPAGQILLDINRPTKVTIYQGKTVVQTEKYDQAGSYTIDTSKLPNGNYRVVVQSGGGTSQVVMRQMFDFTQPSVMDLHIVMH